MKHHLYQYFNYKYVIRVISNVTKTQLQAMQLTLFIMMPSILLSGFAFPYDGMPKIAQYISELLPVTHFIRILRGIILRGASVWDLRHDVIWLAVFAIAGLTFVSLRFKKQLD